jgi:cytochrome d ubiquinol oxidase subunit II
MTLPDVLGGLTLIGLALYAVSGGADFGSGLWDRLATGPRKTAQRQLIEKALAPIWETNHVWLIFVVVLLFSGFPAAFAAVGIALGVPLSLALVGIVLRGAAFVFRQYGRGGEADTRQWGRVFGVSSLLAPFFLGTSLAALTGGRIRVAPDGAVIAPTAAWWDAYPIAVGFFVVVLFAYLAAVYLTVEAEQAGSPALADDFRARALACGLVAGLLSILVRSIAGRTGGHFAQVLLSSPWSRAAEIGVAILACLSLAALVRRRYHLARGFAIAQVLAVVLVFGIAQHPFLIAPDLRLADAAAPTATQQTLLVVMGVGTLLLAPALVWLFRTFKRAR